LTRSREIDPKGRVDLLLLRLAEHITGQLDQAISRQLKLQVQFSLWPHVEPLVKREIKRRKIPARSLSAAEVATLVFEGPRRLKCTP